jgi:hypothetical protein
MKGSKRLSPNTPRRSGSLTAELVRSLRDQLRAAHARELELLRQLAEKDAQIRLVLEERFFKPVVTDKPRLPEANVRIELAEDVVHFPTAGDAEAIAKQEEEEKKARETLDQELASIADEHHKWHEDHPELPAATFAEASIEESAT